MKRAQRAALTLVVLAAALLYAAPALFMVAAAFTPDEQVLALRDRPLWRSFVPAEATTQNVSDVFARLDFGRYLFNSLLITGGIVLLGLVVNGMAGYALARLEWRGRGFVLLGVLALLVIPLEAIAVPLFFLVSELGWRNTYTVQIVPFVANPFSIYLFATFFRSLPRELEEAARLDGAGPWTAYWRVVVPVSKPAFAAVAILTFLMTWGAYLWPLMVTTGPEVRPLPVAMGQFPREQPVQWGDVMAFATLMVAPVLAVFLGFQRWFVRGIAAAGVKG